MKYIDSYGGPYIIIAKEDAPIWLGTAGKSFFSENDPGSDDYQALDYLPAFQKRPVDSVTLVRGSEAEALIITMPCDIAVIASTRTKVLIAQIEFADPDWDFKDISEGFFEQASLRQRVDFSSKGQQFTIFDSACAFSEVEGKCLDFSLAPGDYVLSAGLFKPDDSASLLLYRIAMSSAR